jgi:predicted DNA-binding transcriptional regulator AlpA
MLLQAKTAPQAEDPEYLDQLLGESDAARLVGFSVRSLQGWRVKGGGPRFVKIGGRSVRYRRRDLLAWAEANLCANTSEAQAR